MHVAEDIIHSPIIGYGLGYSFVVKDPITFKSEEHWFVHQNYLLVWLKQGLIGLALFVWVLISAFLTGWTGRNRKDPYEAAWCAGAAAVALHLLIYCNVHFPLAEVNSTFAVALMWAGRCRSPRPGARCCAGGPTPTRPGHRAAMGIEARFRSRRGRGCSAPRIGRRCGITSAACWPATASCLRPACSSSTGRSCSRRGSRRTCSDSSGSGSASPRGVPPLSLYLWFGAVLTPIALLVLRTFRIYRSARTARLGQELFALAQGMAIITAIAGLGVVLRAWRAVALGAAAVRRARDRDAAREPHRGAARVARHAPPRPQPAPRARRRRRRAGAEGRAEDRRASRLRARRSGTGGAGRRRRGHDASRACRCSAPSPSCRAIVERTHVDLVYLALARSRVRRSRTRRSSGSAIPPPPCASCPTWRAHSRSTPASRTSTACPSCSSPSPGQGWNAVLKRAFDLVCSGLGLVVLSPVLLAIARVDPARLAGPGALRAGRASA